MLSIFRHKRIDAPLHGNHTVVVMKLLEFLKQNKISKTGTIEFRLIEHADYQAWKNTEHFPGYSGRYGVRKNDLKIICDQDDDVENIALDTTGMICNADNATGFVFVTNHNERAKLVFFE